LFRDPSSPNFQPLDGFFLQAAAGTLPPVVYIDLANDEHPKLDIRAGEFEVAQVVTALRQSPNWQDSILFLTYDEHGGFYDHVASPVAPSPDSIRPGECADLSKPPISEQPGYGANCSQSAAAAQELCAMAKPGEPCADFVQYGFRSPLIAISPFSKPHYVSHVINDQTSILALIEKRFLGNQHLTARDAAANTLDDMFDFQNEPSMNTNVPASIAPPPSPNDPGCS
jgi:phospholipase C